MTTDQFTNTSVSWAVVFCPRAQGTLATLLEGAKIWKNWANLKFFGTQFDNLGRITKLRPFFFLQKNSEFRQVWE